MKRWTLLVAIAAVFSMTAQGQDVQPASYASVEHRVSAFSGLPVPRYESLRYPAVHGRAGPSLDYPIVWRYERSGLPVLVLKESRDWRRVRDPDGDEVWMHKRMLGGRITAMVQSDGPIPMVTSAATDARPVAKLEPGVIADLIRCEDDWCQLAAGGRKGWVPAKQLWGAPE